MRSSRRSLFAVVLSVVAVTAMAKPNILFIAVDDLRPSIGCYGDELAVTPNIDRLAKRGVRFGQAHCQVAVCNPSRASLMTGLRPDMLGVWTLPIHFREAKPKAVTLPQWLRRHGYTAVGHGKIYHNPTPDPQSWSEPIRPVQTERGYADGWQARIREVQAKLPDDDWRKNNLRGPATAAPVIDDHKLVDGARTNLAIEDLRRLGQAEKPFFLALGFIRPHLAWISPRKYWDLHDPKTLPVITDGEVTPHTPPYALSNSYELTHYMDLIDFPKPWDERRVSDTLARRLMHAYYASVSYVDAQIGRLLKALDEEGLAENTIIVLWSDHGWKLGEHNGWGKMSNYEIDTRVPFIIAAPGLETAGQATDTPVELLDIFPTLCDLTGIDTPDFVQGESLLPLLKNPTAKPDRVAHSQYYRNLDGGEYMGYAMRTRTHRFVEWREFGTGRVTARELYDHRENHTEAVNVIGNAPEELVTDLTSRLLKTHPRRALQMVPAVHSNPNRGRLPAPIKFANRTDSDILVYGISPQGRRTRRPSVVKPGGTKQINARIGGVFVVESRDGTIHEIHSPAFPEKTINIQQP
ncbi:MAG: sulfatase [Verrucomicrobiota bacterium]|nr:sulfatase [Verrucomicrobiota bacterium]MDP6250438.1 sulfatase [Verrucomicrobiota bacterium]MDP7176651.1 sulfatase [Verrucomicrobiota bacterium]MDP7292762.1 sulfatase [Verrucomicrobiota bacterium]MDP7440210.1 sulfatase [Verrucomicrobiota bacterium]